MIGGCQQCGITVEHDDREDARMWGIAHWYSRHAAGWCRYCQSDTGGPRADHPECEAAAFLEWCEVADLDA